jgi:hypothetical protein
MGMDRNTTGADANADAAAQQQPDQQLRHLEQALRQRDETIGVLQVFGSFGLCSVCLYCSSMKGEEPGTCR